MERRQHRRDRDEPAQLIKIENPRGEMAFVRSDAIAGAVTEGDYMVLFMTTPGDSRFNPTPTRFRVGGEEAAALREWFEERWDVAVLGAW